ncbi:FAD-dependent oxidoreductase [Fervidobacterium thailandense]|uniref:NADH oxidase n=1 Tax=Fervidobacterium thailandense TaxID=1008305 RepID=A0A1E3G074_9BACT|nr:FAD-dependent oxidoreductase [Fervidobacterium thailandense]ODN29664.1 NADH oxidase [Fervidobacterium thailandense]
MKVIVVGCTHAGTAFVTTAKKLYGDAVDITIYEKNDTISFLSCGIALHVGGIVKDPMKLFYSSPEHLFSLGATPKMRHEVLEVNPREKYVVVRNMETGETFRDHYDKLVVTTGSWPIIPNIPGVSLDGVKLSKNFYHAKEIVEASKNAQDVVIVGAGYIGVELAEAFRHNGKNVVLIDLADRILSRYLDKELSDLVEKELTENGIKLALNEKVVEFLGENGKLTHVVTDKNKYRADMAILAVGFRPNTDIFKGLLKTLDNGAIIVDKYLHTSEPDIFAAGDCAAVWFTPTESYEYIPLATNAVRMGTIVAYNLFENKVEYKGTQGTSGVKIFSYNIAATGLTHSWAQEKKLDIESVFIVENNRPEFMNTYEPVYVKLIFERTTGRVLGGQVMSKADVVESANTLSLAVANKMTVLDLAFSDFFFQPHFNKPWNFLNTAALRAVEKIHNMK